MNCCNPYGTCTQDGNCPVREAAHTKAAEQHFAPDYGNPGYSHTMLPRRIRAWDWLGNLPHRFWKYVRTTGWQNGFDQAVAVLLTVGCFLVAPLLVRWWMK